MTPANVPLLVLGNARARVAREAADVHFNQARRNVGNWVVSVGTESDWARATGRPTKRGPGLIAGAIRTSGAHPGELFRHWILAMPRRSGQIPAEKPPTARTGRAAPCRSRIQADRRNHGVEGRRSDTRTGRVVHEFQRHAACPGVPRAMESMVQLKLVDGRFVAALAIELQPQTCGAARRYQDAKFTQRLASPSSPGSVESQTPGGSAAPGGSGWRVIVFGM